VIGASTGLFGAVWAQAELRKVLKHAGADVLDEELPVGLADQAFTADDELADAELHGRLVDVLEALAGDGAGNVASIDERVRRRHGTPALRAV
jgi:chromate reductase